MMKIGVIGSGNYKNKEFVIKILNEKLVKNIDIIISGHSPRNPKQYISGEIYYDNVDIWAEEYGNKNCLNKPIIHKPRQFTTECFKERNGKIARDSDIIIAFIPKEQYVSGTWNTINWFVNFYKKPLEKVIIYNEIGLIWNKENYPSWLK